MDEHLRRYVNMLNENEITIRNNAGCVLSRLCEKILNFPDEETYRIIHLSDSNITEKLLPASGAMECLFEIGFTEDGDRLSLPKTASLTKLKTLQKLLSSIVLSKSNTSNLNQKHTIEESTKSSIRLSDEEKFFNTITEQFHNVMRYEDCNLQEKARKVIPIAQLEIKTMERLRKFQKNIKHAILDKEMKSDSALKEDLVNSIDLFLMELLHWFKYDFFQWVDSPLCTTCSTECSFEYIIPSSDPKCSRIEAHRCNICKTVVKFPRYSDPEILLTTRSGRCGEWANVFTLLCRTLNYDARLVYDVTDHLWTEIWSVTENRWIHIDPCENVIDQPLMYERGWNKKLSYIIAYSRDEVQDVTWRYTRKQNNVMAKRRKCSEENLLNLIQSLNEKRQNSVGYSIARKQYVIKRRLRELVGMLNYPNIPNEYDNNIYNERTTGSYAWRMARGEASQHNVDKSYTWDISKNGKSFILQYFIVKNIYKVIHSDDHILEQKYDWREGVSSVEGGIFHKVENDWKMAYLTRSAGAEYGYLKWSFEVRNPNLYVNTLNLQAKTTVFQNAKIVWEVEGIFPSIKKKNTSVIIPISTPNDFTTEKLKGAKQLNITVKLSGGEGSIAWQHAQLFRESLNNTEEPSMIIVIKLGDHIN
ncbi:PREDICTED: peptide-N(4)-(N-acetyl-beta-glucosaminyl)asparagine amidase [Polistes canadensis]|uniref:peptide-N(4)-(N-acetyl-beta- glucosaminyl)asparagine amidase n=1 Tax=Polistes canadensis TaxID=91411 RepID=UPI000718F313|nr:PREDICTED: peptide-N(4)-(N-acetyl-beta-glucosaminyl)asparagine amidase [Polistes canadensis]